MSDNEQDLVTVRLTRLADQANEEYHAAQAATRSSLQHARAAGEALNEAKTRVPHGEWGNWIAEYFDGSCRTARMYQRIARNWSWIKDRKRVADLSVRGALRLLRDSGSEDDSDPDDDLVPKEYEKSDVWRRVGTNWGPDWRREYWGMPEYRHDDLSPFSTVKVHIKNRQYMERFGELVEQTITESTRSIWYPKAEIRRMSNKEYRVPEEGKEGGPRGKAHAPPKKAADRRPPIYIVSKGRWETRYTSDWMNEAGVAHFLVAEPEEAEKYRAQVGPLTTVLELDMAYKERYDPCDHFGGEKPKGAGPARNFVWDHAAEEIGSEWHWVMDDNIQGFYRYNDNLKTPCGDGTVLRCMEDFAARYRNVVMAGPRYFMFVTRKTPGPPLTFNTRIYSCNLIRNAAPFRWRGRYNEDTDLSLRMLKEGYATVLFSGFLQYKTTTMTMEGGNTDTVYAEDPERREFAEMLQRLHPDVARVTRKWGRWHHDVDYKPFKGNRLDPRPDVDPAQMPAIDDYGMRLFIDGTMQQKKEAV